MFICDFSKLETFESQRKCSRESPLNRISNHTQSEFNQQRIEFSHKAGVTTNLKSFFSDSYACFVAYRVFSFVIISCIKEFLSVYTSTALVARPHFSGLAGFDSRWGASSCSITLKWDRNRDENRSLFVLLIRKAAHCFNGSFVTCLTFLKKDGRHGNL